MYEVILTSVLAFVSTNIDDIMLLTLFFANKHFKPTEVISGQYLGIIALIVVSLIGSLADLLIRQEYIGLLGLIPIYLGITGLIKLLSNKEEEEPMNIVTYGSAKSNVLRVAGVTFANGGDNIGIYVPLFSTFTTGNKIVMIAVFLGMTFLWCQIAGSFTRHPYAAKLVSKWGHIITPFVLLLLGIHILHESGSVSLLTE